MGGETKFDIRGKSPKNLKRQFADCAGYIGARPRDSKTLETLTLRIFDRDIPSGSVGTSVREYVVVAQGGC